MQSPGLTWVIVAGRPTHVSQFASLRPRRRPRAACPECGRRLTLKLGRVRRHHAAHAPHDRCVATNPETALHLDLKFHIAARLEAAIGSETPLVIHRRCAGARSELCDTTHEYEWVRGWDEVLIEARLGSAPRARPDILLRRGGAPIAAIEVLVSHAVDDDKAAALQAAGVPWVEIKGDAALLGGATAWSADRPLGVEREGAVIPSEARDLQLGVWRCPRHDQAHRDFTANAAVQRAAEAEAGRRKAILRGARVVDIYHAGGGRDRAIYRVEEQLLDGSVHALVLRNGTREIASEPANDSLDSRRAAWATLRAVYAADVERLAAQSGGFADSPMRWASRDAAANLVYEALSDLAPGDPTPLVTRYPRRWFYARERGQWFLPREMQGVRWDRPEPDAFAAHPAWATSRAKVRERPAPEYAWSTFVFASRPSVHAFGSGLQGGVTQDGSIAMLELQVEQPLVRRMLVVLTAAAAENEVRRVARSLDAAGVEHIWLSHPRDWTSARADLAWAPAGRDGRGRGVVVIDGLGVYRAEQFVRVFARGDRPVTPAAVVARMAERVARLGAS